MQAICQFHGEAALEDDIKIGHKIEGEDPVVGCYGHDI
jgi:hypothetical protein